MSFDIIAIGRLAGELQAPVRQIERIAIRLGITPAARINNVIHFATSDVEQIASEIRSAGKREPAAK